MAIAPSCSDCAKEVSDSLNTFYSLTGTLIIPPRNKKSRKAGLSYGKVENRFDWLRQYDGEPRPCRGPGGVCGDCRGLRYSAGKREGCGPGSEQSLHHHGL